MLKFTVIAVVVLIIILVILRLLMIPTLLSYKFESFLLLDGTIFKDIPHDDRLTLNNFAIAAWIKTNQSNVYRTCSFSK